MKEEKVKIISITEYADRLTGVGDDGVLYFFSFSSKRWYIL